MARSGKRKRNRMKRKQAHREEISPTDGRRVIDRANDNQNLERASHAISTAIRANMYELTDKQSKSQEGGSVLGRAFLVGNITEQQFNAGKGLGELLEEWTTQNDHPHPAPPAMDMNKVAGSSQHEEDVEKTHRLNRRVDDARNSVNPKQWAELTNVCWLDNAIENMDLFTGGLNRLTVN